MKKLLKVTALLFVAAAMFAGCSNNASGTGADSGQSPNNNNTESNTSNSEEIDFSLNYELFSKDDVSIDVTDNSAIEFEEGKWRASIFVNTLGTNQEYLSLDKADFIVDSDDKTLKFTKLTHLEGFKNIYPEGTSQEQINALKQSYEAQNYEVYISGNTLIAFAPTQEANEADLLKYSKQGKSFILNRIKNISIKTNEDNSKFFGEKKGNPNSSNSTEASDIAAYIMKK